jgi:hypothetical protein
MLRDVYGAQAKLCCGTAYLMKKGPALRQSLSKLTILYAISLVLLTSFGLVRLTYLDE